MELAEALPRVAGVATQLEQLLVNLVNNARDAMSETPRKELTLRACPDGDRVRLEVEDSGCGMDEAVRGRLFEKFFTTKESGSGTGLGMTVVEEVIRAHQAELQVHSSPEPEPASRSSSSLMDPRSTPLRKRRTAPEALRPDRPLFWPGILL